MCFYASLQDVAASEIKVQVCVYAFDLLYLNGEVRPSADEENITQLSFSLCCCHLKSACVSVREHLSFSEHACMRRPTEMPTMSLNANDGATGGSN